MLYLSKWAQYKAEPLKIAFSWLAVGKKRSHRDVADKNVGDAVEAEEHREVGARGCQVEQNSMADGLNLLLPEAAICKAHRNPGGF